jgi:oxygen-dependent protoporphyrinogen oxidase
LIRRGPAGGEESVAQLVRRRLGPAVLERAVAPWIAGTWAGDPERLSAPWALPRLAALERDHRSLLVGALVTALRSRGNQERRRRGGLTGFAGGFGSLAEALAERLADVRTGCPATAVGTAAGGGLVIETAAGALTAPRVVLAVPADRAAALLSAATGGASDLLAEIPYAPLAVVSLGYRRDAVRHPLDGFGFLAVPGQGLSILGCIFPASLFPDRAPEGHAAFTAFLGGRTDPAAVELPDRELLEWVIADLSRALGLAGEPVVARVHRWRRAIPQYEIGHGRFVARAAELEARLPGLRFAVNGLDGTAVPDCVARARRVAYELAGGCSDLAVPPPR